MNGLLNENFLYGFLLARDREDQNEKLQIGLTAGQFPARNPLGLVLLKGQIDRLEQSERVLEQVRKERDALRNQVQQLSGDGSTGGQGGAKVAGGSGEGGEAGALGGGSGTAERQAEAELRGRLDHYKNRLAEADKALAACHANLDAAGEDLAARTAQLEACTAAAAKRLSEVEKIFADYETPDGCKAAVDEIKGLVLDAVTP